MEGGLPVVIGDVHLGPAVLHQLQQDLQVALAAGQVQGRAALLVLPAVGTAAGVGRQVSECTRREVGRALGNPSGCRRGTWAGSSRALLRDSHQLVHT